MSVDYTIRGQLIQCQCDLDAANARIQELQTKLAECAAQFQNAVAERNRLIDRIRKTSAAAVILGEVKS